MEGHWILTTILSLIQKHVLTTSNGLIQVNRSLSRLAAVFITFDQSDRGNPTVCYREFNNFKHPADIEAQLQIDSKKFPEMKMTSTAEVFAKLRDACRDLKPLAVKGSVY